MHTYAFEFVLVPHVLRNESCPFYCLLHFSHGRLLECGTEVVCVADAPWRTQLAAGAEQLVVAAGQRERGQRRLAEAGPDPARRGHVKSRRRHRCNAGNGRGEALNVLMAPARQPSHLAYRSQHCSPSWICSPPERSSDTRRSTLPTALRRHRADDHPSSAVPCTKCAAVYG